MLDPASWLPKAQELAEGRSARVGHDCGSGSVMIVEHKPEGWSAYCYRCSDKGWNPKPLPSLAERMARKQAQREAEQAMEHDPRPPYPPVFDVAQWPLKARVWLYKAGLFNDDIKQLGAYFHERSQRVVLPVMQAGKLVYWQARDVGLCDLGSPKYINPKVNKAELVAAYGTGTNIVLTEDILSAFRVGMATEAWSLLGTKLLTPVLARLIADGRPVIIWLDSDKPGQDAATRISRSLANVGVRHHNIVTDLDPKNLSRHEIEEVLNVARHQLASDDEAPQELQAVDSHSQ